MPPAYSSTYVNGVLVIEGSLEEQAILALRNDLRERSSSFTESLIVDLSGLVYLSSLAIGVLVKGVVSARDAGTELVLVARRGTVSQRILDIDGMPHYEELPPGA